MTIVKTQFPDLEKIARMQISAENNPERLQRLIVDLLISHSQEGMKQVLLSL
jgi:hypothetical protein